VSAILSDAGPAEVRSEASSQALGGPNAAKVKGDVIGPDRGAVVRGPMLAGGPVCLVGRRAVTEAARDQLHAQDARRPRL
jgi:hypothetical protein